MSRGQLVSVGRSLAIVLVLWAATAQGQDTLWKTHKDPGMTNPSFAQTPPATTSPADVFASVSGAVIRISIHDKDMTLIARGSGFFISEKGWVVTNCHVIEGAYFAFLDHDEQPPEPVEGVLAIDRASDLALLKVQSKPPKVLLLAATLPPVGTKVLAIGSPKGLTNTLSEGIISGYRKISDTLTLIQTTAPISPGSSGGPLLTQDGKVIGVTAASLSEGQNINFAVPASNINALLAGPRELRKLGSAAVMLTSEADTRRLGAVWAAIDSREYPQALKLLQDLHSLYAGTYPYLFASAFIQYKLGNYELSIDACHEAIKLAPGESGAYFILSDGYTKLGRYGQAVAALRDLVAADPSNLLGYKSLAGYISWEAASISWEAASLGLEKRDEVRSKREEAVSIFRKAVSRAPGEPWAYRYLGELYRQLGFACVGDFQDALRASREKPLPGGRDDARRRALGPYQQGISAYKSAIEIDPRDADAYFGLAELHSAIGSAYIAELTVNLQAKLSDTEFGYREKMRRLHDEARENQADALTQAVRLSPEVPEDTATAMRLADAYSTLATLRDLAFSEKSLALYRRELGRDPTNETARGAIPWCLAKSHRYREAIDEYVKLTGPDQDRLGSTSEGIEDLRKLELLGLTWKAPAGWTEMDGYLPEIGQIAVFKGATAEKGRRPPEITITYPAVARYDVFREWNLQFWIERSAQGFGIAQNDIKTERIDSDNAQVVYFEIRGYFKGLDPDPLPRNDYTQLTAVVESAVGPVIVHVRGPTEDVKPIRDSFRTFVGTLRVRAKEAKASGQ